MADLTQGQNTLSSNASAIAQLAAGWLFLPLAAMTAMVLSANSEILRYDILVAVLIYGALTLSIFAGVHWGCMVLSTGWKSGGLFFAVPIAMGWPALLVRPVVGCALLAGAFIAQGLGHFLSSQAGWCPQWMGRISLVYSAAAASCVTCTLIVLFAPIA